MFYLLYGNDTYRSSQKLSQIKNKYLEKYQDSLNLSTLNCEERFSLVKLESEILAMPFLIEKRLVILKNLMMTVEADIQLKIKKLLAKVPETTILVFYEIGNPKQTLLFKTLNQPRQAQQFELLQEGALRKWILNWAKEQGKIIEPTAIEQLMRSVGSDLWRMENELTKLSLYADKKITPEEVKLLVRQKPEIIDFDLSNALSGRNMGKTFEVIGQHQNLGENSQQLFVAIQKQLKSLLLVKDLLSRNINHGQIAKILKWGNPGRVYFAAKAANNFSLEQLKVLYQQIGGYDIMIKTGVIEPEMALDLVIGKICK